jgi:hypothetical protein
MQINAQYTPAGHSWQQLIRVHTRRPLRLQAAHLFLRREVHNE